MYEKFHKILNILFGLLMDFGILFNLFIGIRNHDAYNISIAIFIAVILDAHFTIN